MCNYRNFGKHRKESKKQIKSFKFLLSDVTTIYIQMFLFNLFSATYILTVLRCYVTYSHWKQFLKKWLIFHLLDGIFIFFLLNIWIPYWIFGLFYIVLENITKALNIIIYKSLYIFLDYLSKNGPSEYELLKDYLRWKKILGFL